MRRRNKEREPLSGIGGPAVTNVPRIPAEPVEVVIDVPVPADRVVEWFLSPARWPRFQGRHAWLDPSPGGRIRIELGDGVFIAGSFLEIGDRRVQFTWGREDDLSMPPGSTTVTVSVEPTGEATSRITLVHVGLPDRTLADEHGGGWRYHLIRLGVAAGGSVDDEELVELFLAASTEPHAIARRGLLERTCSDDVHVADGVDDTHGVTALAAKLGRQGGATSSVRLVRTGPVVRVGALIRCPYALRSDAGQDLEHGELVASLDRDRRMAAVSLFA